MYLLAGTYLDPCFCTVIYALHKQEAAWAGSEKLSFDEALAITLDLATAPKNATPIRVSRRNFCSLATNIFCKRVCLVRWSIRRDILCTCSQGVAFSLFWHFKISVCRSGSRDNGLISPAMISAVLIVHQLYFTVNLRSQL